MALRGILHLTSQSIYIRTGNPQCDASNIESVANVNATILLNILIGGYKKHLFFIGYTGFLQNLLEYLFPQAFWKNSIHESSYIHPIFY